MNQDEQHLKLLSIFHYVVGGMLAVFACIPFIHFALGIFFLVMPKFIENSGDAPPAFIGWFFIIIASIAILLGWTMAILIIISGRFLNKRTHYYYCFVTAGIECLFMPAGTILGVFTIIVLLRDSVKQLFGIQTIPQSS